MANQTQVELLKEKGVKVWNEWREKVPDARPNLEGANLEKADLREANLSTANLDNANLAEANLLRANLTAARLSSTNLQGVDLTLGDLFMADLKGAHLCKAVLDGADLMEVDLRDGDLGEASLILANFTGANVANADFSDCSLGNSLFGNIDLSRTKGLDTVHHHGPSTIGIDTIYLSGGNISEVFLRGAGVPEPFIVQMKSLVAAMSPIEFSSCFISYSSKDQEFAERLHADLRSRNVRCWFAPEDLKIGDRLRPAFDEAIRLHDKLMVLLSENSVSSPWVEKEVETAFEKERREKRTVLFPIRLDDAVMETNEAWAADIRRTRHIGDFRDWKNHDSYKKAFDRLMRDLKA